jgi:hypothetical protein
MAPKRTNWADRSELSSMYTDEVALLSQRRRQVT